MALTVEFAVAAPGSCPVAEASGRAGTSVDSVSRASLSGDGLITEEFAVPAGAESGPDASRDADGDGRENLRAVGHTDEETIYRFERDGEAPCVCESIERIAGPATDVRAENGTLLVTARAERLETVREVVERLRERFDGVSVRRLVNLAEVTDAAGSGASAYDLTDRQREVLRVAYEEGYFEYPKEANAGEVADALDITRSTLVEHLAAAQGKILSALFAEDAPIRPSTAPR